MKRLLLSAALVAALGAPPSLAQADSLAVPPAGDAGGPVSSPRTPAHPHRGRKPVPDAAAPSARPGDASARARQDALDEKKLERDMKICIGC